MGMSIQSVKHGWFGTEHYSVTNMHGKCLQCHNNHLKTAIYYAPANFPCLCLHPNSIGFMKWVSTRLIHMYYTLMINNYIDNLIRITSFTH